MTDRTCKVGRGLALSLVLVVLAGLTAGAKTDENYLSPLALAAGGEGKTLYIAAATAKRVVVFDLEGAGVTQAISLRDPPSGLALSPDGRRLYVTGASPEGRVHVVDLDRGKVIRRIHVGHTPVAPVVSPDGKTLYVCNKFNNDVSVIPTDSKKEVARIPVSRQPSAAAITPDGKHLVVANLLPAGRADQDYTASVVSIIDTGDRKVVAEIQLPNGSTSLRGVAISPDGRYAYVTHILARYQLPTTQLERGWMNTNALTIIDVAKRERLNTVLLDDVDLGAANPWGVACTDDGKYVCVAHAGTHEVSVIDRAALHEKLDKVAAGEKVSGVSTSAENVPNDLAFMVDLRRRLRLAGNGPRGLCVVGSKVYAAEYFTDSLGVADTNPDVRHKPRSLALGPAKSPTIVRKGERYFNDAEFCFQKWQSCASCHPDVRNDGLNWDLLNDGLGNPKNTKSLVLAHRTPPTMITGARDTAEAAVRAGLRHIQFSVRPEEDCVAIDEYLKSLEPVSSPHLSNGHLSWSAWRGKRVFKKAGCARCHPAPLYTNMKQYSVGTGKDRDRNRPFDTPTLREAWRTGPYLYDGRATTVEEVLTRFNENDQHGATSQLTEKQLRDLIEFVLSL